MQDDILGITLLEKIGQGYVYEISLSTGNHSLQLTKSFIFIVGGEESQSSASLLFRQSNFSSYWTEASLMMPPKLYKSFNASKGDVCI